MYSLGTAPATSDPSTCPTCPTAMPWGAVFQTGFFFALGASVAGGMVWLIKQAATTPRRGSRARAK